MKVIRDQPGARGLPSRSRYALFRLFALLRYRNEPVAGVRSYVVIDCDQSNFEAYTVGLIMITIASTYCSALFPRLAILSPVIMGIAIQIPVYITGLLLPRGRQNQRVQSRMLFLLLLAASVWFATRESWVRYVALAFLAGFVLNAIAFVVMLAFRGRVEALERQCGL